MRPFFESDGDTISYEAHICIVFTADGSGPQLLPMVTRSVAMKDNSALRCLDRCVDLAATYGTEVRKTRLRHLESEASYLVFYNLSPKLPVNRTLAQSVDFNPNNSSRLFWRGDVVVMKVDLSRDPHVRCLDASMDDEARVQAFFLDDYRSGSLEEDLSWDEDMWKVYCDQHCQSWLSYQMGKKCGDADSEAEALSDINELRALLGHQTLPPHPYMKCFLSSLVITLSSWIPSRVLTGVPKLDPDTERVIFEMCAQRYPHMCPTLVLVARRVKLWVDPILYRVIDLEDSKMSDRKVESFYSNNLLKPVLPLGFYALHVKSLWIPPSISGNEVCDSILTACSGVEDLAIFRSTSFLENPSAWRRLRRLTTRVTNLFVYAWDEGSGLPSHTIWPFEHACFVNLTHLHLYDDDDDWPRYCGWENLRSLTHLALACASPNKVAHLRGKLPRLLYTALGHYVAGKGWASIDNAPHLLVAWPKRVVCLGRLTGNDWGSGARGGEDMWTLVEREVARRIAQDEAVNGNQEVRILQGTVISRPMRQDGLGKTTQPISLDIFPL